MKVPFSSSSAPDQISLRRRFEASWWCRRWQWSDLTPRGGMLGACRSERVRPVVASLSLLAFLGSQCVLPGAFLLSEVHADQGRRAQAAQAREKAVEEKLPLWAKLLRAKVAREKAARAARLERGAGGGEDSPLRLTQAQARPQNRPRAVTPPLIAVPGSRPGRVEPSRALECEDCEVDVRALDLSKVPSERELRRAGQLGGALNPLRPADPQELKGRLELLLRRAEIPGGLAAQLPARDPRARGLEAAKKKLARAQALNLDFGGAIQEWNKHNFRVAARMFEKHVKDYPDSPWAGEALLHLGCDAKYNGRFDEAQRRYDGLLRNTRSTRNERNRQKKRERRQGGAGYLTAEQDAAVTRALAGVESLEQAVARVDAATEADDESFEIHQKAKARFADLDLATGRLDDAAEKFKNILQSDTDWRRRTWASHWLYNTALFKHNARDLRACGSQALGYVLASLGRDDAAQKMRRLKPHGRSGFSLGELERLAKDNGLPMRGFKAKSDQLSQMPMPLIVHYDFDRNFSYRNSFFGQTASKTKVSSRKTAWSVADKGNSKLKYQIAARAGHFLVVKKADATARKVTLYDPQEKRLYSMTFAQFDREWSGQGLTQVLDARTQVKGRQFKGTRLLSQAEMSKVVGGCCGVYSTPTGTGDDCNNQGGDGSGCGANGSCGAPVWSVNRTNQNVFITDTPIWYETPVGPDVKVTLSYNSQDSTTQHNPFGNKWMFNYSSYVVEDTAAGGGRVTIFLPDGSQTSYSPNGTGGYDPAPGIFDRLHKSSSTRYEVHSQNGEKAIYDIPSGTTSLQPFLIEFRDRWGHALHFGYDAEMHLTQITDAQGKVTTFVYNAQGKISRVWDPFGRHASFSYDANGNLIEVVDMEGHAFQFTYDENVYVTGLNTAQGPWTFSHSYGYPERDVVVTDPTGKSERWHSEWWGPEYYSYTDKNGASTGYTVGEITGGEGRVTQVRLASGGTTSTDYDPDLGLPTTFTNARGKTTQRTYNATGHLVSATDAGGTTTRTTYASNGRDVTKVEKVVGTTVIPYAAFGRNAQGQPTSLTNSSNQTTQITYTAWGAPATETDDQGHVRAYNYDATTKQLMSVSRDGVSEWGYTYDAIGRVKTQTDVTGYTVAYQYNNLDQVTRTTFPDGTYTSVEYVCCGIPGLVRDRSGRISYYDYDAMKRLVRTQDAQGNSIAYDYDGKGNVTRMVDAKGGITRWQYDAQGRATAKTDPNGDIHRSYYANGVLEREVGPRGQEIRYSYDDKGHTTRIDYTNPAMADVTFSYDALDRLYQMTDGLGTTTYSYDSRDLVTRVQGPFATINTSADAQGRPNGINVNNAYPVAYAYDDRGRMQSVSSPAGNFNYSWIGDTAMRQSVTLPNGATTAYGYDSEKRLTSHVSRTNGGALISGYAYGHDTRGVQTFTQRQVGTDPLQRVNFGYDEIDQLVSEVSTEAPQPLINKNYAYDPMGNRTRSESTDTAGQVRRVSYTPNKLNQITGAVATAPDGTTSSTSLAYDKDGNLTEQSGSGGGVRYVYNDANQLVQIVSRNAAGEATSKSEFRYDGFGRKAVSSEWTWNATTGTWDKQSEVRRVYDGRDVIQERDGQNNVIANYVRVGNIGGLLARTVEGRNGAADAHFYYHSDGRGNVTQLTDASGETVARYAYDSYGNMSSSSGAQASGNPYRYQSKEYHGGSGMYDWGFRFYSTGMGRWLTRDPLGERGGLNLYGFVENSPTSKSDSYGLLVKTPPATPPVRPPAGVRAPNGWRVPTRPRLPGRVPVGGRVPRGGGAALIIGEGVNAGTELIDYEPCQPTGPYTRLGEQLADWWLGETCECPDDPPPTEAQCRAAYDADAAECSEQAGEGRDYDPLFYRDCLDDAQERYEACQRRIRRR